MRTASLDGISVVSFESRLADVAAQLIRKYGGHPLSAPSMQEVPREQHQEVFRFAEDLFAGRVDVLVCLTGVGTRMLVETMETRAPREDILQALADLTIVARGPKPVRVLKDFAIPVAIKVPEPNTWRELLHSLETSPRTTPLQGRRVAIQEYGQPNDELVHALEAHGAQVMQVPIYRWMLPDDTGPLKEGIQALIDGRAQVALFTSRTQVDHMLQVAVAEGQEAALRRGLEKAVVASVGPICTEALTAHGIAVDFEPEHPKLGTLIRDLAKKMPGLLPHRA